MNPAKCNTDILFGYTFNLYPDDKQKQRIQEIDTLYKFVYNFTLERRMLKQYGVSKEEFKILKEENPDLNIFNAYRYLEKKDSCYIKFNDMCKIFADFRNTHPWLQKLCVSSGRYAIKDVYQGYNKFFSKTCQNKAPKFKSKRLKEISFGFRGERMRFVTDSNSGLEYVKIEGIDTPILYKHSMPFPKGNDKKYYNCRLSFDGYKYSLSFQSETYNPVYYAAQDDVIGIDVGIRQFATLSDGSTYTMPDLRHLEKRKRRAQSKVSKDLNRRIKKAKQAIAKLDDIPLSKREQKRYINFRRLSKKIVDIKHSFVHKVTREIVNRYPSAVVMENLSVKKMAMMHNGPSKLIYGQLFYEMRRQMEYKCKRERIPFILADPHYPSSQICSSCGARYHIGREKIYHCYNCGLTIDRDLNAALNLKSLATV